MFFIGQEHVMPTLGDNLWYAHNTRQGLAILFRGASGYGKTELAKRSCNFLVGREYEYCLGNKITFNESIWVHFIDEIHKAEEPEILYPIIDSGKYVFIFATNFDSLLPEALTNRCINFVFTDYSDKELRDIYRFHAKLYLNDEIIDHIINVSGRNPRIMIKTFLNNIEIHFAKNGIDMVGKTNEEIIEIIDNLHGIRNGLDKISRQYLETLKLLGGRASINLLASTVRLDINTIKYTIEPALLYKKKIKITSKGRELCQ